ncbi:hypothetical protein IM817_11640 [Serratia marcescens]|uniref:hypothetical protein n=1 Tax=Serratia marcescens TaxID=615 RepID=UPI001C5621A3|nr:hypothetical protein [Serratia marcescens]QXX98776.1 hypothetical protein IM817_11640 [Serratia marcescens]
MPNQELKRICLAARNSRDSDDRLDEQFLCREVSIAICIKASEAGLVTCLCWGTFKDVDGQPQDHYWVRHEGMIYDATADQFDPKLEKVHIDYEENASQYYEKDLVVFNNMVCRIVEKMS